MEVNETMSWADRDFDITIELSMTGKEEFNPYDYVELVLTGGYVEDGFGVVPCNKSRFVQYKHYIPDLSDMEGRQCLQVPDNYTLFN